MKTYIKTKLILFISLMTIVSSCELAEDLDNYEPLYSLPAEEAIYDEPSAELALSGVYNAMQDILEYSILPSTLSGVNENSYFALVGASSAEELGFINNDPITDGTQLRRIYASQYTLVNRANWLIEKASVLTDDDFITPGRRVEMIGEAKILRALGHFHLLRLFGQFYDTTSEYGINIRLEPAREGVAQPRNTVSESYDAIINDLDDGIEEALDLRTKYFVNKTFAKGLKAKVMLYMGDYSQAATIAQDVILNSGSNFQLIPSFEALFDHQSSAVFNNNSSLFNIYSDSDELLGLGNYWDGIFANVSNTFVNMATTETININGQSINYDATRVPFMLTGAPLIPGFVNGNMKFRQRSGGNETLYILRMAEMYLIFAEADARNNMSVTPEALQALNDVRVRAGATDTGNDGFEVYPSNVTYTQFLELVRIEKRIELATEQGEDWFDLVRYDYIDSFGTGFQVSDVKPTATNSDKFIMPIPQASFDAGGGVIEQNPSY